MQVEFSFRHVPRWIAGNRKQWLTTNADWPDPTNWVTALHDQMAARAEVYGQEPDMELRRNKAANMLGLVVSALHDLPVFQNSQAHLPLKDLLIFFQDLERGRVHPWTKPVNGGGTNATPTAERELREWAVTLVHIMLIAGYRTTEAYRLIADTLTESGRRGKDGNPVSWRSVQRWYVATYRPLETNVGKRLGAWWQIAPCPHGELATNCSKTGKWNDSRCSQSKEIAHAMAKSIWQLPHLRDWFHPMVSD